MKMLQKNRKYYSKKLFSLNSSVMDDDYDTYKTANIEITVKPRQLANVGPGAYDGERRGGELTGMRGVGHVMGVGQDYACVRMCQ